MFTKYVVIYSMYNLLYLHPHVYIFEKQFYLKQTNRLVWNLNLLALNLTRGYSYSARLSSGDSDLCWDLLGTCEFRGVYSNGSAYCGHNLDEIRSLINNIFEKSPHSFIIWISLYFRMQGHAKGKNFCLTTYFYFQVYSTTF